MEHPLVVHEELRRIMNGERSASDHAFIEHCAILLRRNQSASWAGPVAFWIDDYRRSGDPVPIRSALLAFLKVQMSLEPSRPAR